MKFQTRTKLTSIRANTGVPCGAHEPWLASKLWAKRWVRVGAHMPPLHHPDSLPLCITGTLNQVFLPSPLCFMEFQSGYLFCYSARGGTHHQSHVHHPCCRRAYV